MQRNKITIALDAHIESLGFPAGHQVVFNDGLPTVDDGLAFYISQLTSLESRIYEAKYANINYADLVPVQTDLPEWADSWDYISYDGVTLGKFIGSSADDLPKVTVNASKSSVPIGYAGNMYDYSLDELRKSQQLRIPLDITKGRLAFRGAQEHTQRVAYFGDAARGMTGLFNNPNLALSNSTLDWFDPATTGMQIVEDVDDFLGDIWTNSATVHVPNVLVLDPARWRLINSRPMSKELPNTTILQYLKANNVYTGLTGRELRVEQRLQLSAAQLAANGVSNGNKDRMMAYELNDENLAMQVPIPWRSLAPQMRGLMVEVPCEYKCSGVEVRFPFCGAYRDQF
ncbi:DUF2184 domain-containing protein [Pseudomonas aeruginosa]|uniref:DUF2184 domain-containing protein n=1 Tax=Pseudomonas aeruginosa TaxID=287 RepID=UPI00107ED17E|nr:DUF2184 domain-containing protein [Pseudomonas aeruginosa]TGA85218.1 DUF2184 domain-containing protein [Pseudomonas aeruginosa]